MKLPSHLRHIPRGAMELAQGPIARASGLSLGIRLAGLALSFAQAVLTARLLGPAGYGTVATILSVAQVVSTVAVLGLGPLAVREVPAHLADGERAKLGGFLRLSMFVVLASSCGLAALVALAARAVGGVSGGSAELAMLGGLLIVPLAVLALVGGWSRGFGRIATAQVPMEVVRPAIMVAAMGVAFAAGMRFGASAYFGVAIVAASIASLLATGWLWRSDLLRLPRPVERADIRPVMGASLPFLGLGLASILQGELNTLLLAVFAGPHETGLFQPVARIAPLLTLPVQAAGMRYAPRMAEFWRAGEHERIRAVTRTFTWTTTLLTLLIALAIAGAGPWLMLAFGGVFAESAPLLWIIAAAQVFNAACGPVGMLLTMSGHTRAALLGQVAGVAVNGMLGWLLIPEHGAPGAAIAMAGGIVVWNAIMLVGVVKLTGIRTTILSLSR